MRPLKVTPSSIIVYSSTVNSPLEFLTCGCFWRTDDEMKELDVYFLLEEKKKTEIEYKTPNC